MKKRERIVEMYAELSKSVYELCTKKELIRRKCLNLGRMECDLLNYLNMVKKPVCMNDLSVEMKVSHSRITRIIDTLVRKKLVRRFPSKKDRRSWLAEITDKGRASNQETLVDFLNIQEDLISRLPEGKAQEVHEAVVYYMAAYKHALLKKEARDLAAKEDAEK